MVYLTSGEVCYNCLPHKHEFKLFLELETLAFILYEEARHKSEA